MCVEQEHPPSSCAHGEPDCIRNTSLLAARSRRRRMPCCLPVCACGTSRRLVGWIKAKPSGVLACSTSCSSTMCSSCTCMGPGMLVLLVPVLIYWCTWMGRGTWNCTNAPIVQLNGEIALSNIVKQDCQNQVPWRKKNFRLMLLQSLPFLRREYCQTPYAMLPSYECFNLL